MNETTVILPELAAWLLLVVLAVVLLLGFLFLALVLHMSRRRLLDGSALNAKQSQVSSSQSLVIRRSQFELPPRWLAVRSTKLDAVQAALGLTNPTPCPISDGLTGAEELNLFISPPIAGWILVTGSDLPDPAHDVDECFIWLQKLSSKLGEVQFFSANRALNHHAWARLLTGEVFRAYAWTGETLWNQGALTRAEIELGFDCRAYGEREDGLPPLHDTFVGNTEKVPLLAARWSLDPATIDTALDWPQSGIAGELNQF